MPKKVFVGKVVSDKMDKTVTVAVTRLQKHPLYKKYIKRITKFKAHDEGNVCRVGDTVKIIESRPLSKTKRWVVIEVLNREVSEQ
ncbi:MAG TPA: 30S ribosomal protein S17 [Nitrospirae bacterium]|nr:30S ribosomal protein S17 [Nitrospirota bacterium]